MDFLGCAMQFLKSPSLLTGSKIEIPEVRYKADLELLDKYINFSSELVRLSLASIGGIGFILGLIFKDGKIEKTSYGTLCTSAIFAALIFLVFALASALGHRYYASDGIYHHLRAIKHLILIENNLVAAKEIDVAKEKASQDEIFRNNLFRKSGIFLSFSAVFLLIGVSAAGLGLFIILI